MSGVEPAWHEENQRALVAALHALRGLLQRRLEASAGPEAPAPAEPASLEAAPTLDHVAAIFGLSPFERSLLLLCAGMELDGGIPALVARAHGDSRRTQPTFGLALALLPGAHWSALSPDGPLRYWQLLEVGAGESLVQSPLRIDERILHHLAGLRGLDARLQGLVEPLGGESEVVPSQLGQVERLLAMWSAVAPAAQPVPVLAGGDRVQRGAVAVEACRRLEIPLYRLRAASLPTGPAELVTLQRLWEREGLIHQAALLLEWPEADSPELVRAASSFAGAIRCPLAIGAGAIPGSLTRPAVRLDVELPRPEERALLVWRHLGEAAASAEGLDAVSAQFHLGPAAIRAACAEALTQADPEVPVARALWAACRRQARPRLDDLAQRIDAMATWDDLVLPEPQVQLLKELVTHVRHRGQVYAAWGFAERQSRGLGIGALFAGPSGTGKTMAAEVMAGQLQLDLYRIDLSQVVSKYIGETEKNLRRIFDAADEGGAILLFDEADALFGKRSEVKDSHDRYANLEVSYLLQRMEAYRGLAILTTNFKSALDSAFMRRLRFVVQFPFPDAEQRQEIWRRVFPQRTPLAALDYPRLARANVAGGSIRNIALNAAFMAAAEGARVGMGHLLRATRMEYAKLEKPLTDAEVAGWQ